jgi:pimeloyl-ACP methyl ester carboxylesterase
MTWVSRVLLILTVVYLVVLALFVILQRRLIYYPTTFTPGVAEQVARETGSVPWRNAAGHIIGWQWPAREATADVVLIVHGNAGSALDRDYLAAPVRDAAAVDVFVLEYPGYGVRTGVPSEASLLAASDEALRLLAARRRLFVVSESLGAGVAAHLAAVGGDRVSGLLLFAPYTSLVAVAQKMLPFLPVRLLMRDRFDAAQGLASYHGPVAVVLAGSDEVIGPELGRRLYDSYDGPKQLETIAGARHNDITSQSPAWWRRIFAFWEQHRAKTDHGL